MACFSMWKVFKVFLDTQKIKLFSQDTLESYGCHLNTLGEKNINKMSVTETTCQSLV